MSVRFTRHSQLDYNLKKKNLNNDPFVVVVGNWKDKEDFEITGRVGEGTGGAGWK